MTKNTDDFTPARFSNEDVENPWWKLTSEYMDGVLASQKATLEDWEANPWKLKATLEEINF